MLKLAHRYAVVADTENWSCPLPVLSSLVPISKEFTMNIYPWLFSRIMGIGRVATPTKVHRNNCTYSDLLDTLSIQGVGVGKITVQRLF